MPTARRLLLVLVLVAFTACGARLSPDQVAASQRKGAPAVAQAVGTSAVHTETAGAGAATPGAGAGSTAVSAGGAAAAAQAPAGTAGGSQPTACAPAPTDAPGVTDTEVRLGNVSTIGGPVPGLSQTIVNGTKAYFAYRNNVTGGVCGRKLTLVGADDRLDAGTNRAQTEALAPGVFAFVGSFSAVDDGGASVLAGTNIADVSLSVGHARVALPNNFSPNPFDPVIPTNGQVGAFQYFKSHYGVSRGGVVWPAQSTARAQGQKFLNDMRDAGIDPVSQQEVALTESSYVGAATKLRDDGVDIVVTALEINGVARLAQAFQQIGYTPKVAYYGAQSYGGQLAKLAGSAADGALIAMSFDVAEDVANPAVATMVDWYRRVNGDADLDVLAMEGWVAAAMFAKALEQAGPAPTRDAVLAALQGFHDFDADGLAAPIDAAGKKSPSCFLVVTLDHGHWRRVDPPTQGFIC